MGILDEWKVTRAELDEILATRPSARGYLFGFVAEYKVTKMHFTDPRISGLGRSKDHERARPGDFGFNYKGVPVTVSCKSLQTASVKPVEGGGFKGSCQCDASDRRTIRLPNNEVVQVTNVLDQIADVVLAYRPKPKTKPAKRRKRRAAKIAKGGDAGN